MNTLNALIQRKKKKTVATKKAGAELQFSRETSPLDNPKVWLKQSFYESPLGETQLKAVQDEVDSILGTTRGGKSIGKVVWNGDRKFWKEYYTDWNSIGKPKGDLYRRPHVLYKTVTDSYGRFVKDVFPPRFLILTRIEPEQYVNTWERDSKIWCPVRKCDIQVKPYEAPKEMYIWFKTIARHNSYCCGQAAKYGADCYGFYVHPRYALEELREIMHGIEKSNLKGSPFDSPDAITCRLREQSVTNYHNQAMKRFAEQAKFVVAEMPLTSAPIGLVEGGASLTKIREVVGEMQKRQLGEIEKKFR